MSDLYQHHINDFEVWVYPEVNSTVINELVVDNSTIEEDISLVNLPVDSLPNEINSAAEERANDERYEAIIGEKINYLDDIGSQMADMLSEVDSRLLQSMVGVIKQAVKKIILKELMIDEHRIKQMIEHSLEKINKDKVSCVIHVSEEDYPVFENKSYLNYVQIIIDPELGQGSFIIKTKFSKLQAILEDRLTVLFGL